ncbi:MarC family protein [Streptacidiphilus sp. ASG 303]|uniref:MarC family protein n=1 Tax=Streptacidiphilus sp. ASG 303 TaxID=2896847 RepID=UPI001E62EF51|nr:MarC family protein [Streptacidiphilus sp. ASG 303]MCD0485813.1 MarC family protein [Streptacidiphilus sp. ASG 303]
MNQLSLGGAFITFLAVVGPPKVLLSFASLAQTRTTRQLRTLALVSSAGAALVGLLADVTAPALFGIFHISTEALEIAGGAIFFVYAVGLVLGLHFGVQEEEGGPGLSDGIRELLLPYIVSPLAMTALLLESTARNDWTWRAVVGGAYVAVVAIDLLCVLLLNRVLQATHHTTVELLARLLGLLLAAVGVDLVLDGLEGLAVPLGPREY